MILAPAAILSETAGRVKAEERLPAEGRIIGCFTSGHREYSICLCVPPAV
jgi:hypothetical protein